MIEGAQGIVGRAMHIAEEAHRGQLRKDGSPYFSHCQEVARIITDEWRITDQDLISAAYLHDTPEDTQTTLEDLRNLFGDGVALLVEGVSKFESDSDRDALRKVFDRNLIDPRVAVLKLGDRLHNMRTLGVMPAEKQVAKAQETLEVYAKLAESLGVWVVMKELEDLSLQYTNPSEYERQVDQFKSDTRTGELFIGHMVSSLESLVRESGVDAKVVVRKNSLWRLRHKAERVPRYKDINDVVSFRVIVDGNTSLEVARNNCYQILGKLRQQYATIEEVDKFSDYFSNPQDNGYSAIQMTINTSQGMVEIAITTLQKEEFNNWGVVSLIRKGGEELSQYARKLVFTPSGQAKFFPKEATGVDFAYSISRGFGAQAVGVLVDGEKYPISYVVPNGATLEVIAGEQTIAPDPELMNYCLPATRKIIEEQLGDLVRERKIREGKEVVQNIIKQQCGLTDLVDLFSFEQYRLRLINVLYHLGCKGSLSNLYYLVGSELISLDNFSQQLVSNGLIREKLLLSTILLEGIDRPGMLMDVGLTINEAGGNIGAVDLQRRNSDRGNIFSLRLVVENLDNKSKEKIKNSFSEKGELDSILVV